METVSNSWYAFALEEYESADRHVLFCRNCGTIFFIKVESWRRMYEKGLYSLSDLEVYGDCCKKPNWFFITDLFEPMKDRPLNISMHSYFHVLKDEYKLKFLWDEII